MAADRDVGHFDRWAPTYDYSWAQRYITRVHAAMLDSVAASPQCILDIGCGTGRLLSAASARWPQAKIIGVDPAARMVEVAQRRLPAAVFKVAQAEALPLPDEAADLVLSSISFHHWADQPKGLAEAARVLRLSGQMCLADIVLPRWWARLFGSRVRSARVIPRLLETAGLQVEMQKRPFVGTIAITSARKVVSASDADVPR